jgi:hypothetical protein
MTHPKAIALALTLALCLTLSACTTTPTAPPAPPIAAAQAPAPPDPTDTLAADLEGSETGAAVGLLTRPVTHRVMRWIGQLVMQAVTNTTVQIQMSHPSASPPESR